MFFLVALNLIFPAAFAFNGNITIIAIMITVIEKAIFLTFELFICFSSLLYFSNSKILFHSDFARCFASTFHCQCYFCFPFL